MRFQCFGSHFLRLRATASWLTLANQKFFCRHFPPLLGPLALVVLEIGPLKICQKFSEYPGFDHFPIGRFSYFSLFWDQQKKLERKIFFKIFYPLKSSKKVKIFASTVRVSSIKKFWNFSKMKLCQNHFFGILRRKKNFFEKIFQGNFEGKKT